MIIDELKQLTRRSFAEHEQYKSGALKRKRDMPSVVSGIDGTSHEIQVPSNEPQQVCGCLIFARVSVQMQDLWYCYLFC
jgi:hypothetical protein